MTVRALAFPALLTAAAATLIREAVTRSGVGPIEYAVSALLVAGLLWLAIHLMRRSWTERPRTNA